MLSWLMLQTDLHSSNCRYLSYTYCCMYLQESSRVGRYTDNTVYRRYQPIPVWLIYNIEIPFVLVIKYFCGLEVARKPLL